MSPRALFLAAVWIAACAGPRGALQEGSALAPERPTLHVRQAAPADVVGDDDVAIETAVKRLRKTGGTLVLGPGRYVVRRQIELPPDLVLRGEEGAILRLPSPALTAAPAAQGSSALEVEGAHEFAAEVIVQVLPPVGSEFFPDGKTPSLELQWLEHVEGARLVLRQPLPCEVPAGSRVGYPTKVLLLPEAGRVTVENLEFEGGKLDAIPMPGHHQRCALWAAAAFGYGEERLGPPGSAVVIRECAFRDWYGRAIAIYHHVDGLVERNSFERIADEAIDLDHFVERFTVRDNLIRDALWGIALNDASRCLIESNHIEGGEIGIWVWWWHQTPQQGVNEENVIRANTVRGATRASIRVDVTCHRNLVEENTVDGPIEVVEPTNTVRANVQVAPEPPPK
jgi:hypothetical protein